MKTNEIHFIEETKQWINFEKKYCQLVKIFLELTINGEAIQNEINMYV